MRKLTKLTVIASILILVLSVSPAAASSPPLDVEFVVPQTWDEYPEGPILGTFTASGPAVEAGVMCSAGDVFNLWGFATPKNSDGFYTFHIVKAFSCSGAGPDDWFVLRLDGRSNEITGNYNWVVWKASGVFDKLHGTGTANVDYDGPAIFIDTLTGQLHID